MVLAMLSAQLQDCYNAAAVADADALTVRCPVIGQAYVACADDKLWYRAQVLGEELRCLRYTPVVVANALLFIVVSSCFVTLVQSMESQK